MEKFNQATGSEVTQEELMKKIHTLRSQFRKEMKDKKASQTSAATAADTDGPYVPKLWCFDDLMFLTFADDDVLPEDIAIKLDESQLSAYELKTDVFIETLSDSSACLDPPSPSAPQVLAASPSPSTSSEVSLISPDASPSRSFPATRPTKKRKIECVSEIMQVALQKLSALPTRCESDPCLDFGRVIGNELQGMKEMQRKLAKKLLFDVVYLGNMDMLTVNHQIVHLKGVNYTSIVQ